jgi:hypothetical protein
MAKLSQTQCTNLLFNYFLSQGWFPPGTNLESWTDLTVGDLAMDDPPLPGDPHVQKARVAADLQMFFFILGSPLRSPLGELKKKTKTLADLVDWCHTNQGSK